MRASFLAIDKYIAFPVYCTEVKQYIFILECCWHNNTSLIPELVVFAYGLACSRKGRFYCEGNQNFSTERCRLIVSFWLDRIIPHSIEIQPRLTYQLRTWIFCKGI